MQVKKIEIPNVKKFCKIKYEFKKSTNSFLMKTKKFSGLLFFCVFVNKFSALLICKKHF